MNIFVALGGGDEIGASCYFLKVGDSNIMLDCGSRQGIRKYPYFDTLIENNILRSSSELDMIVISHAHKDHYAALPTVANLKDSRIISTEQTKAELNKKIDILYKKDHFNNEEEKFEFKHLVSTIFAYDYFETIKCKDAEVILLPAGHIPGAAITLIIYQDTKIVYTGDFSCPFTDDESYNQLALNLIMDCDLLIMENTNGNDFSSKKLLSKHSNYESMMEFLEIIYPKKLFLVHQNTNSFYNYGFYDKVKERFPSMEVVKVKNRNIYDLGVLL